MGPLRVGVVLDGLSVPEWQARLVDGLVAEPGLSLTVLVAGHTRPRRSLARVLEGVDRRVHRPWARLLETRQPSAWAPNMRRIEEAPQLDLDVVVRLDADPFDPGPPVPARHGEWHLVVGADGRNGRQETCEERSVIPAVLLARLPDGRRLALRDASFATHPFSLVLGQAPLFATAPSYFVATLRRLRDEGWAVLERDARPAPRLEPEATTVAQTARFALRAASRKARATLERPFYDPYHWRVAVCRREDAPHALPSLGRAPFRIVERPADCFYADPFLLEHEGRAWLFVEMCPHRTNRGVLAVAELDARGSPGPFQVILQRDSHLSWPFVFAHGGQIYLLPETHDRRTIELFRCERVPDRWVLDRVLFQDVAAVDPVLLEHDGRLWLFAGISPGPAPAVPELHVFHAPDLRGPWTPHPRNPVVSDVRRARPAGAIFEQDGALVRPGQDCSGRYGRALSFSRIERLTPDEYEEREIAHVGPEDLNWHRRAAGTHTFNGSASFLATDVCEVKFRGPRWLRRLRQIPGGNGR